MDQEDDFLGCVCKDDTGRLLMNLKLQKNNILRDVVALIVSGATINILGTRFKNLIKEKEEEEAILYDGQKTRIYNAAKLLIRFDKYKQTIACLVSKDSSIDLVLDSDWLKNNVEEINFNNKKFKFRSDKFDKKQDNFKYTEKKMLDTYPNFFNREKELPQRRECDANLYPLESIKNF
jgi:hypothetical protein